MSVTELPPMRIIADPFDEPDVGKAEVRLIEDAICDGYQVEYYAGKERHQNGGDPIRQTCRTWFTDPATGERRCAVEVWVGMRTWKRDYASKQNAIEYFHQRNIELDI